MTARSSPDTRSERFGESGTETASSSTSPVPVKISADARVSVLRSDSTSCSNNSSIGIARVMRVTKERTTSSGASRAPYVKLVAIRENRPA